MGNAANWKYYLGVVPPDLDNSAKATLFSILFGIIWLPTMDSKKETDLKSIL